MANHFTLFVTVAQREAAIGSLALPHVTYTREDSFVGYHTDADPSGTSTAERVESIITQLGDVYTRLAGVDTKLSTLPPEGSDPS